MTGTVVVVWDGVGRIGPKEAVAGVSAIGGDIWRCRGWGACWISAYGAPVIPRLLNTKNGKEQTHIILCDSRGQRH